MAKRKSVETEAEQEKKVKGGSTWKQRHEDVNSGEFLGVYGGCNSAWHGLAGIRAGVDLKTYHKKRTQDEWFMPSIEELLKNPKTQKRWDEIVSFDPMGMYSSPPTQAGTECNLTIPELKDLLTVDKRIVNEDGSINATKMAIDYVWSLSGIAKRLKMKESDVRQALYEYTKEKGLIDSTKDTYLPPLGGFTIYVLGEVTKLADPATLVAVRVHDSCSGSDVFGSDICTCRPYLVFSLQAAVETAQRGGVGVIVYFQKEGRSLGEVTKYRVYNARKRQEGGDRAEKYFYQTESIAGIRDARFQELMPDVLHWLGINRIDWLLSMSSDKYDAIVQAGIDVMQRVPLPDMFVPKGATVEITAKISAGYHTETIASEQIIEKLRDLEMIRDRCSQVFKLAKENKTRHFELDLKKLPKLVDYVIETTNHNYSDWNIPYHSRWRHFDTKQLNAITSKWSCSKKERVRRLIDLCTVSVLLDAGAGKEWKYIDPHGRVLVRSEGLAAASLSMFRNGLFSSDPALPHRVNAFGLANLTETQFEQAFQATEQNPLIGLKDRFTLLKRLGNALQKQTEFFGTEVSRPGNLVDYLLKHAGGKKNVSVRVLWKAIIEGFESIWPENMSGVRRGDVWTYSPLKKIGQPGSDMVPFHKLSQWLTYSLLEPLEELGIVIEDTHLLTGLAEYRNGGLFIDFDVLTPRHPPSLNLEQDAGSELMVELRALTICLLDLVAEEIRKKKGKTAAELPLAKILQGGTWAAGRAIAAEKRPTTQAPPVIVRSNGTVF